TRRSPDAAALWAPELRGGLPSTAAWGAVPLSPDLPRAGPPPRPRPLGCAQGPPPAEGPSLRAAAHGGGPARRSARGGAAGSDVALPPPPPAAQRAAAAAAAGGRGRGGRRGSGLPGGARPGAGGPELHAALEARRARLQPRAQPAGHAGRAAAAAWGVAAA
ncbi:unnamed protein product, partial [Prorocentrum cordatum]